MNSNLTRLWRISRTRICLPIALILICVLNVSDRCAQAQEIKWYPDLKSATEAAAKQNKLVLLHFTADWCRPCKTLETFVFSNPAVQRSFASNVIAVKIDVEEQPDLVQRYAVANVPYDVALTVSGRVVSKRKSPMDASSFNKMISDYGVIINSLASRKNPALHQNLDELRNVLRSETPQFEGQPTSFTPDAPFYRGPEPSRESAELKRKSRIISNPYIKKSQPTPQRVVNAYHAIQNSPSDAASKSDFSVVPNFIPNPFPSVDQNQFVPAGKLDPPNMKQPPLQKLQPRKSNPPKTTSAQIQSDQSNLRMTKNFTPNSIHGGLRVGENWYASTPTADSISNTSQPEDHKKKTNAFKPEPKVVLNDKFYGKPPAKPSDTKATMGTYQAKILIPESTEFVSDQKLKHKPRLPGQVVLNEKTSKPKESTQEIRTELAQASEKPTQSEFALHGKCPVTLLTESKWVDGDKRWGCVHRNRVYIFANEDNLRRFQSDPDAFSPILAGYDPVIFKTTGKLVDGLEEHGVFMGKASHQQVVLFASPDTRSQFQKDPGTYLDTVRQAVRSSGVSSSMMR